MPKLIVVSREGNETVLEADAGSSLMEVIRNAGCGDLLALCGGCRSCATCHIYVDPAFVDRLPAMLSEEDDLFEGSAYRRPTSRLSCQIVFGDELDGLKVAIAPED